MKIDYIAKRPYSGAYDDILAHTNNVFGNSSKITSAHETTHEINNTIANNSGNIIKEECIGDELFRYHIPLANLKKMSRSKQVGLYCLNDIAFKIDEPAITISQVATLVPERFRVNPYELYLLDNGPRYWNDQPLYLADEWVAYINGATVALEMAEAGKLKESGWSEIHHAILFSLFVKIILEETKNTEIQEMYEFNLGRLLLLCNRSHKFPLLKHEKIVSLLNTIPF